MPATQRQPQAGAARKMGKSPAKPSGSSNNRIGRNERNGLLLLTTKKSSTTGGLLSSAVVGASQVELRAKPDAWGVADKQHVPVPLEMAHMEENVPQEEVKPTSHETNEEHHHHHDDGGGGSPRYEAEASWDEYGGRGLQSGKTDEQYTYMSRLAKERADLRRQEEEKRFAEQRNRAAQRLQELEGNAGHGRGGGERKLWEPDGDTKSHERTDRASESPEGE